jgi:hypothetical protein
LVRDAGQLGLDLYTTGFAGTCGDGGRGRRSVTRGHHQGEGEVIDGYIRVTRCEMESRRGCGVGVARDGDSSVGQTEVEAETLWEHNGGIRGGRR